MADFSTINKVIFPRDLVQDGYDFLRTAGLKGYEAVVLFVGTFSDNIFSIKDIYIPEQTSYKTRHGLMYHVSSEELSILDDWLFENNFFLFCQMHTHPGEAYHSRADDNNCIVTSAGAISIVVPNFAEGPIEAKNWAVYRLHRGNGWDQVTVESVNSFIEII